MNNIYQTLNIEYSKEKNYEYFKKYYIYCKKNCKPDQREYILQKRRIYHFINNSSDSNPIKNMDIVQNIFKFNGSNNTNKLKLSNSLIKMNKLQIMILLIL